MSFDPNQAATADSGIFGLPYSFEEASLVFLPVPWEATTSYGGGTSKGPEAIFEASHQVDLFDLELGRPYEPGMHWMEQSREIESMNDRAKKLAAKIIDAGGEIAGDKNLEKALEEVNSLSEKVNDFVFAQSLSLLKAGKILAVVGGDHSVPFGAIKAVAEFRKKDFGILHFDAHSDTRVAYEGFQYSHASIMHNVLEKIPGVSKLVQVGIRDFCEQEFDYCNSQKDRVSVFFDTKLQEQKMNGNSWQTICDEIIAALPQDVWISFDIDGLDPRFCPNTGTPVPGGLDFQEALYLVKRLVQSKRKIIGFDLNEVAPDSSGEDEWDANVGARMLYKLSGWTLKSQGKI